MYTKELRNDEKKGEIYPPLIAKVIIIVLQSFRQKFCHY
jgi:hypothetical protein